MKIGHESRRAAVRAMVAAVALCASGTAMAQTAPPNLEGVWKIATPTTTLKPLSGSVPFTAEGRKAYDANRKLKAQGKFDDYDITLSRCSNPGCPAPGAHADAVQDLVPAECRHVRL